MGHREGYCFRCGKWKELTYLKALCSECGGTKYPPHRETR
jgi:hypothetical protein